MLTRQLALVSETARITLPAITRVSAALQKQAARDLAPIWDIRATVDPFPTLDDVPLGYWPIIVVEDVQNAAGIHLDKDGQPFALVEAGSSWSLTASHECLEMLVDPFGNRLVAGPSPKRRQGRVEFLVEVCDPSEDAEFAYTVNGVLASDFYTPSYFEPRPVANVRYSFTGAITEPRQVLRGGYLSWHDPVSDHWFQKQFFAAKPVIADLGVFTLAGQSIRSMIYALTPEIKRLAHVAAANAMMKAAAESTSTSDTSGASKAAAWRTQIKVMTKRSAPKKKGE